MAEQEIIRAEVVDLGAELKAPEKAEEVLPLNYQKALSRYSEEERQEIVTLANSIDVRQVDKVMSYGSASLKATFTQCGAFLKKEKGSEADQKVIAQVVELSKKASASYEDFNLILQEPNFFQKFFVKLFSGSKSPRSEKVKTSAITSYTLLAQLQKSYESWQSMLKESYSEIETAAFSDAETIKDLEKYIIAGKMAEGRIEGEIAEAKREYDETGLQTYVQEYETLKEGYNLFQTTMENLEKSRVVHHLSIGQLTLIRRSNRNVQVVIHTQSNNSMSLIGQQLRNAVLDAKTREVMEGQKAIGRLNDELLREISHSIGTTAEETEKLIYAGFYNLEAAKEAFKTVIDSCDAIKKTASEELPKMKANLGEIEKLMEQLQPEVGVRETLKVEGSTNPSGGTGKLTF